MSVSEPKPATVVARALGWVEPATRALVPPIYPSASYVRAPDGSYPGGHTYTRDQNPTYDQVEAVLAHLEGAERAMVFASGMAAATTVFDTLRHDARVVIPRRMYWTIRRYLEGRGFAVAYYDNGDPDDLKRQLEGGAELVWIETPANPTCEVTNIGIAAELAHSVGALAVADSTMATPVFTRPLEHGVDIVMHAATKQLSGHSDVLAGALLCRRVDERWERLAYERGYRGAVLGPFEAWLLLRGMRTLTLRVERSAENALAIAGALQAHDAVEQVYYAGLPEHPGHEVAAAQMHGGFGSIVSFRPRGGPDGAQQVAARLELFRNATSLGGVESLVEHRARLEGEGTPVPPDLLRLSVGIEDVDDLIDDLRAALA